MLDDDTLRQPSPLKAVDSFAASIFGMVESEMRKRWLGETSESVGIE